MDFDSKKIGLRICYRRKELRLRQADLGRMLGLSENHISNIENGYNPPSFKTFVAICNALDTTPDYFLLGSIRSEPRENITDMLKLCTAEELKIIQKFLETYLFEKERL